MKCPYFLLLNLLILFNGTTNAAIAPDIKSPVAAQQAESIISLRNRLHKKILSDDQLSQKAHNIRIVEDEKAITLIGPVASRAEKVKLENYARSMAGKKRVYNRLIYK